MFRVITLDLENLPRTEDGKVDYTRDFFNKETSPYGERTAERRDVRPGFPQYLYLRAYVSGREFEYHMACRGILDDRAGDAFADLEDNMALAEAMLKYVIRYVMEEAPRR